jgi:hypothetical protein
MKLGLTEPSIVTLLGHSVFYEQKYLFPDPFLIHKKTSKTPEKRVWLQTCLSTGVENRHFVLLSASYRLMRRLIVRFILHCFMLDFAWYANSAF